MSYDTISSIPDLTAAQMGAAVRFDGNSPELAYGTLIRMYRPNVPDLCFFEANRGDSFEFAAGSTNDPNLRIYDQFGNAIYQNNEADDGGVFRSWSGASYTEDRELSWRAPYTGTYYFASGVSGAYQQAEIRTQGWNPWNPLKDGDRGYAGPTIQIRPYEMDIDHAFWTFKTSGSSIFFFFGTSEDTWTFSLDDVHVTGGVLTLDPASDGMRPFWGLGNHGYGALFTPQDNFEGMATISVGDRAFRGAYSNLPNLDGADSNNNIEIAVSTIHYADRQFGTVANETFQTNAGSNYVNGGSGIDTAVYGGNHADYVFSKNGDGDLFVDGPSGNRDFLTGVERCSFDDVNLAFDTDGAVSAGGIYRLYQAAFDRTPDLGGLGYWISKADGGMSAVSMAEAFVSSQEFHDLYHVTSTDKYLTGENINQVVTGFYNHVLHREPDAGGLNYYVGLISSHQRTAGDVLAEISNSAENYAATIGQISGGISYTPWAVTEIHGTSGNDTLVATPGKDNIDGGAGIDTVVFSGALSAYAISGKVSDLSVTNLAGKEDTLVSIERLKFDNTSLAFDTDGAVSAGGIYRLYQAAFDRTPDKNGLGYWIDSADKGMGAVSMAEAFVNSQEFHNLYHVTSTDKYLAGENINQVVTGFYNHVLHREPDAGGLSHYVDAIASHSRTAGDVLAEISNSVENYAATIGQIDHGIQYDLWLG